MLSSCSIYCYNIARINRLTKNNYSWNLTRRFSWHLYSCNSSLEYITMSSIVKWYEKAYVTTDHAVSALCLVIHDHSQFNSFYEYCKYSLTTLTLWQVGSGSHTPQPPTSISFSTFGRPMSDSVPSFWQVWNLQRMCWYSCGFFSVLKPAGTPGN